MKLGKLIQKLLIFWKKVPTTLYILYRYSSSNYSDCALRLRTHLGYALLGFWSIAFAHLGYAVSIRVLPHGFSAEGRFFFGFGVRIVWITLQKRSKNVFFAKEIAFSKCVI